MRPESLSGEDFAHHLDDARTGSLSALGKVLQACRHYLLLVANQSLSRDLQSKFGPSDVVQDTLLEAQRDFARFHGATAEELRAWLRCILLHNLANAARHYRGTCKRDLGRELPLEEIAADAVLDVHTISPSRLLLARERSECIDRALEELHEEDREIILLRHRDNLPFAEIGRRLGCSTDAAWKRWGRAIEALRRTVGGECDESA